MQQDTHEPDFKITFTPSRVEWITEVTSVTVWPTGFQVETPEGTQSFRFEQIGKIQESGIMRFMRKLGGAKPFGMLVADRDWFHPPQDRYFRFYTDPPMKVYMPSDDTVQYEESVFFRIQAVIRCGGYETFDLG